MSTDCPKGAVIVERGEGMSISGPKCWELWVGDLAQETPQSLPGRRDAVAEMIDPSRGRTWCCGHGCCFQRHLTRQGFLPYPRGLNRGKWTEK